MIAVGNLIDFIINLLADEYNTMLIDFKMFDIVSTETIRL
jgi:hypothetical protein